MTSAPQVPVVEWREGTSRDGEAREHMAPAEARTLPNARQA